MTEKIMPQSIFCAGEIHPAFTQENMRYIIFRIINVVILIIAEY